jgi:hypothetical protein
VQTRWKREGELSCRRRDTEWKVAERRETVRIGVQVQEEGAGLLAMATAMEMEMKMARPNRTDQWEVAGVLFERAVERDETMHRLW